MVTNQGTASGGREQTLTFIGQRRFSSKNDTISYSILKDDTWDDERSKMVKYLKMGLVSYVARTSSADLLSIEQLGSDTIPEVITEDKWDNWVLSLGISGYARFEESKQFMSFDGRVRADRITEDWKIRLSQYVDYDEDTYKNNGGTVTGISTRTDFDAMVVKSLSGHWSAGIISEIGSSSYSNTDFSFFMSAAVEYNIFPYVESVRRDFRIFYALGTTYIEYTKTTIYNKIEEHLQTQRLGINLEFREPWGRIDISVEGSHYFHDITKNRLKFYNSIRIYLVKGLSLEVRGEYSRIHDQLSLPKGDVTNVEILLQVRELETQYSSWFRIGIEYTFGSMYNNIVNPRF